MLSLQSRRLSPARARMGNLLGQALGQSDPGQLPGREPWDVNPPLAGPINPNSSRGSVLQKIVGGDGAGAPIAKMQQPDGSVLGVKMPINTDSDGNQQAIRPDGTPMQNPPRLSPARFDYEGALKAIRGEQVDPKWWQYALAGVGDALAANAGMQGHGMSQLMARTNAMRQRNQAAADQIVKWQRDDYEAERKRNEPVFLSGNSDQVRYDPATGTATRIYDAPQDFEDYAASRGLEPGTEDYFGAVEDYVLRGSGPTAFKYDKALEAVRNANRITLENAKHSNRLGLESVQQSNRSTLRGQPTYRDLNPPARSNGSTRQTLKTYSSPSDAAKAVPVGGKFKTQDGRTVTMTADFKAKHGG